MKQIVIKKWIDGEFREVKRYSEEEVVSIRHHTDGLEIILKENIRLYDTQCIIEFEQENEDEKIGKHLLNWFKDCKWDAVDNGTLKRDDIIAWLEKRIENPTWSEEDERNLEGIINEIEANKNNASDYDLATYDRFLSWLKSLKERVQPQPKQEWSKEDERIFTLCAVSVKTRYNDGLLTHYEYELASLWLESIKERMKGE